MGETDFLVKLSITHLLYEVIVVHRDTFILLITILILLRLAAYQNPKKLEVKDDLSQSQGGKKEIIIDVNS